MKRAIFRGAGRFSRRFGETTSPDAVAAPDGQQLVSLTLVKRPCHLDVRLRQRACANSRHLDLVMCVALSHADMHSVSAGSAPGRRCARRRGSGRGGIPVVVPVVVVVPGVPMAPLVPVPRVGALVLVDGSV